MTDTTKSENFSLQNILVIFRREYNNYFNTPIGYIFIAIFGLFMNFFFFVFPSVFDGPRPVASMDRFFWMLRFSYLFLIPAITMRLWAEESKTGTLELLFTLPIKKSEILIGKYTSAIAFLAVALSTTFFIPISLQLLSSPDWNLIIGGYVGSFFLGAAYISVGLLISWFTKDQIIAFIVSIFVFVILFFLGYQPLLQIFGPFKSIIAFASVSWHFDSIARGLLDTRDIIYYLSFIFVFLYINKRSLESRN